MNAFDEIVAIVVDRVIGADLLRCLALRVAAVGGDRPDTEKAAQTRRHRADTARPAVNEHGFAIARIAALKQIMPYGKKRLGHRAGFDHIEAVGHDQAMAMIDEAIFGIAAARQKRADIAPEQPFGNAVAQCDDLARHFEPQCLACPRRRRVFSLALHQVGMVDARKGGADQNLAFARNGNVAFGNAQYVGSARRIDRDRSHRPRQFTACLCCHEIPLRTPSTAILTGRGQSSTFLGYERRRL